LKGGFVYDLVSDFFAMHFWYVLREGSICQSFIQPNLGESEPIWFYQKNFLFLLLSAFIFFIPFQYRAWLHN